jgi:pSer/pThr/pTyr-binding forkhead associated (FHA) protein
VTLSWAGGQHSIAPGLEVRVGRDPSRCPIALTEPRVSGVHASVKVDSGQLWVRDEGSNNGTYLHGVRLSPGTWTAVPPGPGLRVGPVEMECRPERS